MSAAWETVKLKIKEVIRETADAKSFILEKTSGSSLQYKPGQFLTFLFQKRNGEDVRRNYSVSAASGEPLRITVKRIPNGEFSRWLIDKAKPGDVLISTGASGFFTLPDSPELFAKYFFFAAGSGITPILPMIQTLLGTVPGSSVVLVYSNRSRHETIFLAALLKLQNDYPDRFTLEFFFTETTDILHKRLSGFRVAELLGKYTDGSLQLQQTLFYLCGPFEYMRMISIVLLSNGVAQDHIRKEIFVIEKPSEKLKPPDTDPHQVKLIVNDSEYTFITSYPETILQTAKRLLIPLPYSCESGQCGTCALTCVEGQIWMRKNEVLLDQEISQGRVLTCTGFVVGGNAVLYDQPIRST